MRLRTTKSPSPAKPEIPHTLIGLQSEVDALRPMLGTTALPADDHEPAQKSEPELVELEVETLTGRPECRHFHETAHEQTSQPRETGVHVTVCLRHQLFVEEHLTRPPHRSRIRVREIAIVEILLPVHEVRAEDEDNPTSTQHALRLGDEALGLACVVQVLEDVADDDRVVGFVRFV